MKHFFHVQAQNQPAALERLLRVTRHRGFTVSAMEVRLQEPTDCLDITLTVEGDRPVHTLAHQINKLAEVAAAATPETVTA